MAGFASALGFGNSSGPISSLPCGFSSAITGGVSIFGPAITTASGAVTASTFKTILSVSGRGRLNALLLRSTNATSKTMSAKVTIDGRVVFNGATPTVAATNGFALVGAVLSGTNPSVTHQPIDFQSQCLIEYTSSVTETDGCNLSYNYEVWA